MFSSEGSPGGRFVLGGVVDIRGLVSEMEQFLPGLD